MHRDTRAVKPTFGVFATLERLLATAGAGNLLVALDTAGAENLFVALDTAGPENLFVALDTAGPENLFVAGFPMGTSEAPQSISIP